MVFQLLSLQVFQLINYYSFQRYLYNIDGTPILSITGKHRKCPGRPKTKGISNIEARAAIRSKAARKETTFQPNAMSTPESNALENTDVLSKKSSVVSQQESMFQQLNVDLIRGNVKTPLQRVYSEFPLPRDESDQYSDN